ncbi:hypothetical protein U9Z40_25285 [Escherichia coli]
MTESAEKNFPAYSHLPKENIIVPGILGGDVPMVALASTGIGKA